MPTKKTIDDLPTITVWALMEVQKRTDLYYDILYSICGLDYYNTMHHDCKTCILYNKSACVPISMELWFEDPKDAPTSPEPHTMNMWYKLHELKMETQIKTLVQMI